MLKTVTDGDDDHPLFNGLLLHAKVMLSSPGLREEV